MCGIFGLNLNQGTGISKKHVIKVVKCLFQYSESRGKESSGIYLQVEKNKFNAIHKSSQAPKQFIKSKQFIQSLETFAEHIYGQNQGTTQKAALILAHSRLVTNGCSSVEKNNQPIQSDTLTIVHNGIIVNTKSIWEENPNLNQTAEVDTEVLSEFLSHQLKMGQDEVQAVKTMYDHIKGSASIAWTCSKRNHLTLATNTGDLYYALLPNHEGILFASEQYILEKAIDKAALQTADIQWLAPNSGLLFQLNNTQEPLIFNWQKQHNKQLKPIDSAHTRYDDKLLRYNEHAIAHLKRCTRCILPETFPHIHFNEAGVCNYCLNYKPHYKDMHPTLTKKNFIDSLQSYRTTQHKPNVIVPFSGGRDSSYGLHLICKEFDLNPITFTYDWGMVTDLARRNIARMCGQLGIQNVLFSADIKKKRENIRRNVAAWLKKPDVGMVPLFMAGDKSFFRIVNQLKKQTQVDLNLWCANPLENTDFKSGFCGIKPDFDKHRLDYLSLGNKAKLAQYYASRFMQNPRYMNRSLLDTMAAFWAYYIEPRTDFYFMFNHFIWDEQLVNDVLLNEYDWEISADSTSTWRIGDGTAPFYNYIYNTAFGFSEFDTFRSNQIRENMISRDEALQQVLIENRPRTASLAWYLDTIELDFNQAIQAINALDKTGLHSS